MIAEQGYKDRIAALVASVKELSAKALTERKRADAADAVAATLRAEHEAEVARLREAMRELVIAWEWLGQEAGGWSDAHQAVDATLTRLHTRILGIAEPPAAPRPGKGEDP